MFWRPCSQAASSRRSIFFLRVSLYLRNIATLLELSFVAVGRVGKRCHLIHLIHLILFFVFVFVFVSRWSAAAGWSCWDQVSILEPLVELPFEASRAQILLASA